jgi:hypothetical protein
MTPTKKLGDCGTLVIFGTSKISIIFITGIVKLSSANLKDKKDFVVPVNCSLDNSVFIT